MKAIKFGCPISALKSCARSSRSNPAFLLSSRPLTYLKHRNDQPLGILDFGGGAFAEGLEIG
jgi:hypothetical protein